MVVGMTIVPGRDSIGGVYRRLDQDIDYTVLAVNLDVEIQLQSQSIGRTTHYMAAASRRCDQLLAKTARQATNL